MGKGKKKARKQAAKTEKPREMICFPGSRPKKFGIGQDIPPKMKYLGRMIKWPKYIRLQKQKKILMERLKVPPVIAQFQHTLEKNPATKLFKILAKHQPETRAQAKERVKENLKNGTDIKPPVAVQYGIQQVTQAIMNKRAKLICIANDVDPLEVVMWLPTLCIKMNVPFCIVKGRARLGTIVHQKKCSSIAFIGIKPASAGEFDKLLEVIRPEWLEAGMYKECGGGIQSKKTIAKLAKRAKRIA